MLAQPNYLGEVLQCLESDGETGGGLASHAYGRLFDRIRTGDQDAFEELVIEIARPLEVFALRFSPSRDTAKDLVQDVLAHLWEQRATIVIRGSVKSYLYAAVRNRALDLRRRDQAETMRWETASQGGIPAGMGHGTYPADAAVERREIVQRVQRALATLSPRVREAATLRWADGLTREEIAEVMGVSVATVKNQLAHAAQVVRGLLADLRDSL